MSNVDSWRDCDIEIIKRYAQFLEDRGYVYRESRETLYYEKGNVSIGIYNRHYDENPDIKIKFVEQNRIFGITWFLNYFNGMNHRAPQNSVDCIIEIIKFIVDRYPEIMTFEYCAAISQKIEKDFFARCPELKGIVVSDQ